MGEVMTYAIGDIHGCHDLLVRLLWQIRHHTARRPYRLVFLGDYIDRGPDSASVVRTVRRLQDTDPEVVICLRGNHEDMLLQCLSDPSNTSWWLENGGSATLESFGVSARGSSQRILPSGWRTCPPSRMSIAFMSMRALPQASQSLASSGFESRS